MQKYPKGGILGKTLHTIHTISELKISLHAANAGYFMVLSVFPALLLILSLLRYTGLRVENLTELMLSILPGALADTAEELIFSTYMNASGTMVGVSALAAMWSASRGIYGLLTGLNAIYGATESRGYFYTRAISFFYTFAFLLVLLLTLALHVFGNGLITLLTMVDDPLMIFLVDLIDLRFFLLLFLQTLVFTVMFMVLPDKPNRFWDSLPGGLLASVGWLTFSDLYSGYVTHFSGYTNIYGSVYAVALSMLWLYCCLSILFYGAALNQYLSEKEEL